MRKPASALRGIFSWRLLGPIAVVLAFWWAGPATVWETLRGLRLSFFLSAVVFAFPLALLKGIRWSFLLKKMDIDLPFRESLGMYSMGMTLAAVTPGHMGDFVKVFSLSRRGCGMVPAVLSNLVDRILDVLIILIFGYAGIWYFSRFFIAEVHTISILLLLLVAASVGLYVLRRRIKLVLLKWIPEEHRSLFENSWNDISSIIKRVSFFDGLYLFLVTAVFWLIQFSAIYLCAFSLGLEIPFLYLCASVAVVTVASFVPITVAGAGTRDALFILLFSPLGISNAQSVALASLVLVLVVSNCLVFYLLSLVAGDPRA